MNQLPAAALPLKHGAVGGTAPESRSRRAGLAVLTGVGQQAVRLLVQTLATPVLVAGLGPELYGAWRALAESSAYLALGDVGGSTALRWTLAQRQGSSDLPQKRRAIGAVLLFWVRAAPVVLVAAAGLVYFAPRLLAVGAEHRLALQVAAGLTGLHFALSNLLGLPAAILRGSNLQHRGLAANLLTTGLAGLASAGAVMLGLGLPGVAGAQLLGLLTMAATRLWVARRALPWLGVERPRPTETRQMTRDSLLHFLWLLVNQALSAGDLILVGVLLSPSVLTSYALGRFLVTGMHGPLSAALVAALPGLADLLGRGRLHQARQVHRQGLALGLLGGMVTAVLALTLSSSFLGLWVGPEHDVGLATTAGLTLSSLLGVLLRYEATVVDATCSLRAKTAAGLLSALATVSLGVALSGPLGALGVVLAWVLGRAGLTLFLVLRVERQLHPGTATGSEGSGRGLWLRAGLCLVALGSAAIALGGRIQATSWLELAAWALGVGLAAGGLCWLLGLDRELRGALVARVGQALRG